MTQILTYANRRFVLQVTDRLITRQGQPVDPLSNKNIIFRAPDAMVTMGYTGMAVLDGVPTDQWLAQELTGLKLSPEPDAKGVVRKDALRITQLPRWLDIGRSIRHLTAALDGVATRLPVQRMAQWTHMPFTLVISGFQWKVRKPWHYRPIYAEIHKSRGQTTFHVESAPRNWYVAPRLRSAQEEASRLRSALGIAPTGYVPQYMAEMLMQQLVEATSFDDAERLLVGAIREISARSPYVGPHCMSILIGPPTVARGRVHYVPASQTNALVTSPKIHIELPVDFTPWIIGPGMVGFPVLLHGRGWVANAGGYEIPLLSSYEEHGIGIMSGQTRPRL